MTFDIQTIVTAVGTSVATVILGGIWKGVAAINNKIQQVLLDSKEHKTVIDNHKGQLKDLWQKTSEIDEHLQSTDKNVAKLEERTKHI